MRFQLNEEQSLLRDSVVRWVAERGQVADAGAAGGPSARWHGMAELGWLAMTLPEAHGGLGQGLLEACILAEALGAGCVAEPYAAAIVQAAGLVALYGSPSQRQRWLPPIAAGEQLLVPALVERGTANAVVAERVGSGWCLRGLKTVVPSGHRASAWLVRAAVSAQASTPRFFIVPSGTPGVSMRVFDTVDACGACALQFDGAMLAEDAWLADVGEAEFQRVTDHALVVACAESVGAMRALLKATVDYTRTRQQFGKPLAVLQVLRHRMADLSVLCDEAEAMMLGAVALVAAAERDGDANARSLAAAAARAKVAAAARRVAEEAIQLHGGMGVTEELNVGRHLRRQVALEAEFGSADGHLRRHAGLSAARAAAGASRPAAMQSDDAVLSAFRDEVRAFLAEALTPEQVRAARLNSSVFSEPEVGLPWHRALHRRGWVAPAWPPEYGGTGWSLAQRWVFETECALAGAPPLSPLGLRMAGPVIMRFGTPEQKAHFLPRILSGDDYWCQGYSEPGSGSDLASLATRAQRDGEHYVINGSKIWTTHAHHANLMFALVRTGGADTRKHEGISFLLIDMATPGISVRPIRSVSGDHEVNQVFFDDVRVPLSCRLGDEGQGWTIAKYLLEFERGGAISAGRLRAALERVRRLSDADVGGSPGRGIAADPDLALAFSVVEIDIRALEMVELKVMSTLSVGQNPGSVSSLLKLRWSEIHQSIVRLGVRLLGADALAWEAQRPMHLHDDQAVLDDVARAVVPGYLNARAYTIFGGTSEIQREIIARDLIG